MKNFLSQNWFKMALIMAAFLFVYFSEIRPYIIKKECLKELNKINKYDLALTGGFSERYSNCLKEHGF